MNPIRFALLILFFIWGSTAMWSQEKVYPKNGDGITVLLKRHSRVGYEYQQEFIALNKSKLGRNNALRMGVAYTLPPLKDRNSSKPNTTTTPGTKGKEPLFGKKYAQYDIISDELNGATFYLSSGHGGPDPGAIGKMDGNELHEDEYAYDITLRLARNLIMRGAKVYMIIQDAQDGIRDNKILKNSKRETCMGAAIPLNQIKRLNQRSDKINELHRECKGYARSIFIHIDSRSKDRNLDVFFYHSSSAASKKLANTMLNTFDKKYARHQPNRGFDGTVSQRDLHVLRSTTPAGVYVEVGNIQNPFDQRRIVLSDNRQALANWMCEAFVTDYKQYRKK